jgi:hypothetical protein
MHRGSGGRPTRRAVSGARRVSVWYARTVARISHASGSRPRIPGTAPAWRGGRSRTTGTVRDCNGDVQRYSAVVTVPKYRERQPRRPLRTTLGKQLCRQKSRHRRRFAYPAVCRRYNPQIPTLAPIPGTPRTRATPTSRPPNTSPSWGSCCRAAVASSTRVEIRPSVGGPPALGSAQCPLRWTEWPTPSCESNRQAHLERQRIAPKPPSGGNGHGTRGTWTPRTPAATGPSGR